jgi:hypothetical protein
MAPIGLPESIIDISSADGAGAPGTVININHK